MGRVFANGPEDLGSIPGRVITETLKMLLDTSLLKTQQYKVCIDSKVDLSPTPQWSSYWKGSLLVARNYSRQLYLLKSNGGIPNQRSIENSHRVTIKEWYPEQLNWNQALYRPSLRYKLAPDYLNLNQYL